MNPLVSWADNILGALTILAEIMSLGLLITIVSKGKILGAYGETISKNILWVGFFVALLATSGSLLYSEVAKYPPCVLCWYQRILLYPQVILFLIASIKKDRGILPYAFILSVIGGAIALFHYYGQVVQTSILPCPAVGEGVSCATRFTLQYGYITIPMMSFSVFLLLALVAFAGRKEK